MQTRGAKCTGSHGPKSMLTVKKYSKLFLRFLSKMVTLNPQNFDEGDYDYGPKSEIYSSVKVDYRETQKPYRIFVQL